MSSYRLLETMLGTSIIREPDGAVIPMDVANADYAAYLEWVEAGNVPEPPASPTFADVVQALMPGVQAWMESVVRANGYDSVISCASYANSSVEQWRKDALAVIAWRDAVWQAAYAWQSGANGELPATIPTLAQVIAQLPQPETFNWVAHDPGYSLPPA